MERMTRKNPDGSFRLPMQNALSIRAEWQQEQQVFFGPPIDKLGQYEAIGTPQEFAALKALYGVKK